MYTSQSDQDPINFCSVDKKKRRNNYIINYNNNIRKKEGKGN